jgi:ribonuclease HI
MRYIVHTDGAARGNPGPSAIGVVVQDETGRTIWEMSRTLGVHTNNEAEYLALIAALQYLKECRAAEADLYLDSERVQTDKACREMTLPKSDFIWMDLLDGPPIRLMDHWTRFSKSGVNGDPTLATVEKGKVIFEAVVDNFVRLVREFKARPRGERTDHHVSAT